jgi:hypothetical protein
MLCLGKGACAPTFAPMGRDVMSPRWLAWLVFAVACLGHLPALFDGFVLDDYGLLVSNPFVRDPSRLWQLLSNELFWASGEARHVPYYRPLSGLLYWLSFRLVGGSAPLQHALNLLLHGALSFALFKLLVWRQINPRLAAIAVALFAVHPATPDIVAYIGGRQDMLGWLLVIAALLLMQRWSAPWVWLVVCGLTTLLAALTREFFLATPLLLLSALVNAPPPRGRRGLALVLGGTAGVAAVLVLRYAVDVMPVARPSLADVLRASAGLAARMLNLGFWPSDVSVDVTPPALPTWAAVLLLVGLGLGTIASVRAILRRDPAAASLALLGWAAFWATVVLHVPRVVRFDIASDRYAYGVVMGMACLLASVLAVVPVPSRFPIRASWRLPLAAAGILALFPLTWARAAEWRSEATLQSAMYRTRPSDPQSLLAEGTRRFARGEYEEAYRLCRAYADARPDAARVGFCLGYTLLLRGEPRAAARALEPFVFSNPGVVEARVQLFRAWFAVNDLDGVRRGLARLHPIWPEAPDLKAAEAELKRRTRRGRSGRSAASGLPSPPARQR